AMNPCHTCRLAIARAGRKNSQVAPTARTPTETASAMRAGMTVPFVVVIFDVECGQPAGTILPKDRGSLGQRTVSRKRDAVGRELRSVCFLRLDVPVDPGDHEIGEL